MSHPSGNRRCDTPHAAGRALLVAFHYPPEISGGAPRLLYFEDYLVRSGWDVTILTPQPAKRGARGGDILRLPPPSYLAPAGAPPSGGKSGEAPSAGPRPRSKLSRAFRQWVKRWLFIPDLYVRWSQRAADMAIEEHCSRPFDLVITSSPQESGHTVGRRLQQQFRCPWLADFRDGWTFEPHRPDAALPVRNAVEWWLERRVLRKADWVTAATRPIADDFRERFAHRAATVFYLPTGFQESPPQPLPPEDGFFRLVYTGRFGLSQGCRTPERLVAGLRLALADADFARRFRLRLVGDFSADERALWNRGPLADCIEEVGPRPYDEAVRLAASSTMLLLVTPPGLRSIATRKLFDYLAVRRPVFALAENNEAARILEETQAGMCVSPEKPEAIAAGLRRAFDLWRRGELERAIPCSRNDLYRAEPHFDRVLGKIIEGLRASPGREPLNRTDGRRRATPQATQ